jgi:hypothetical protein
MSGIVAYILEAIFNNSFAMSVTLILLPPAFFTIGLLSVPMPDTLKKAWITLLDLMLFKKVDISGQKLTLYKICVLTSLFAFILSWGSFVAIDKMSSEYALAECVDSKEWWCSLFTLTMYLTLDRFRKSVKKELGMYKDREQEESESEKKKTN